jgi:lipopolysaccharide transport system permease protein
MSTSTSFNHYRQFVFVKVAANLRSEAVRNYLSYIWWFLEPLLHMVTYYLVFSLLLRRDTEDFVIFLLIGLIPYLWFSKTISHGMLSIVQGRGLMMQVHLPKIIFPTIVILHDTVKQFVVFIIFLAFILVYGINPSPSWLSFPLIVLSEFLLITACCYLVAAIVPFLPDFSFLVTAGLQLLLFCSGVFYNIEMIAPEYRRIFYLNPMANLLHNYREVLMYDNWPDWHSLAVISGSSIFVICCMWIIIRRFDHIYPRVVL